MNKLSRAIIMQAITRMGELAQEDAVKLEICLYGGVVMMLAYQVRENTKDVDAILRPAEQGLRYARQVAKELGLPENWLNSDVRVFLGHDEQLRNLALDVPGLMVTAPTAGYLLAMKALACRDALPGHDGDLEDLKFLLKKLEIKSVQKVQEMVDKYYKDDVILPHHAETINALIKEIGS